MALDPHHLGGFFMVWLENAPLTGNMGLVVAIQWGGTLVFVVNRVQIVSKLNLKKTSQKHFLNVLGDGPRSKDARNHFIPYVDLFGQKKFDFFSLFPVHFCIVPGQHFYIFPLSRAALHLS